MARLYAPSSLSARHDAAVDSSAMPYAIVDKHSDQCCMCVRVCVSCRVLCVHVDVCHVRLGKVKVFYAPELGLLG